MANLTGANRIKMRGVDEANEIWETHINPERIADTTIPESILFYTEESENEFRLMADGIFFKNCGGFGNYTKECMGEIVFDKGTKTILSKTLLESLKREFSSNEISIVNEGSAICFAAFVLSEFRPYCYSAVKVLRLQNARTIYKANPFISIYNLLNLFIGQPDDFEKIVKISPKIVSDNFNNKCFEDFMVDNSCLPSKVLSWVNSQTEGEHILSLMQAVGNREDGNNVTILQDYVNSLVKAKCVKLDWSRNIGTFYRDLKEVYCLNEKYRIKPLLEYLIRQSFYYGSFLGQYREVAHLKDYVHMAIDNGLEYELYPQDIAKAHNCMMRNTKSLACTPEVLAAFKRISARNKKYEVELKDYVIVMPSEPVDLVNEGNALNHCVGNYVIRVAEEKTIVGFLRKKDKPNESLVTIEIQQDKIVQAKKICNEDADAEIWKVLKSIERKWKTC